MPALTSEEMHNALELIDFESIIEPVCERCPKAEDCSGYLSSECPFSAQLMNVRYYIGNANEALQDAINFADGYEEYKRDMEIDIHRPSNPNVA